MLTLKTITQAAMLGSDPESGLLSSAAQAGIATLGGLQLAHSEPVTPCPPETLPPMPEAAAQLFKRVLAGEFEVLLTEFLQLIAACRVIVPPETLPALLGLGKKELRPLVLPVIGERGRWLASFNPSWAYALPENDVDWETGSFEQRRTLIERLRVTDPAKARDLVQSTWKQDSPEARLAFLMAFTTNLSQADEDFLEACLADRRKEIRDTVLDLLVSLSDSKLSLRVFTKLKPFLQMESKLFKPPNLTINLPDALDDVAKELGLNVPPLGQKLGEQANCLAFLLSLVPPAYWTNEWRVTPEKAIEAAVKSDWADALLSSWFLALQRVNDPAWALAMAEGVLKQPKMLKLLRTYTASSIMGQIYPEKLEALAQSSIVMKLNELNVKHPLLILLENYHKPWSIKLTRTVFASLRRQAGAYDWKLQQCIPGFALYISPEMVDELAEGWPKNIRGWEVPVTQLLTMLRFRHEMIVGMQG